MFLFYAVSHPASRGSPARPPPRPPHRPAPPVVREYKDEEPNDSGPEKVSNA